MGIFEIIGSRRLGLCSYEFNVVLQSGDVFAAEIFPVEENGSLWEYIIISIEPGTDFITLGCVTWLPASGAFVGLRGSTRVMNATDRKRYAKALPEHLRRPQAD
ncbi:hypothetical protein GXW71_06550 [Roseomonas hellenica]|uniref:Uncharacterized protein n=1 Tax=Plastoroseomonas hellenica TaxID=2687306 RepID=A0ABS5EUT2_9PROT|nr:hypothetical protein [Plastoroseomonas hellenica]MBR0664013.1 hypothetical protein [Plastoroseomonas hellenica]